MRVYISVDLEGIAGVGHPLPTRRGDDGYAAAVRLMTGETNAAIDGAFRGGATEVLVNDSHGGMYNLPPADVDRRARVLDAAALVPGNARVGDRGVRTEAPDAPTAYRGFLTGVRLASALD